MEIEKLSIADLKAAWDFVKEDLKVLEKAATENNVSLDKMPAYDQVKSMEDKLYHKLLNLTRQLK